jgi:hypothetical protein
MTRFFALPVMATVLALVGVRMLALPAPVPPAPQAAAELPMQDPEAAPSPIVTPQDLGVSTPPTPPPPTPPAPAPKAEPVIIVLEPLPAPPAPEPKIVIVNAPVISPQTTVVNNYYPVVEVVTPPPAQEAVEVPVAVGVGVPLCAAHRRPGCCLEKPAVTPQDTFFKKTPFLPPTPRRVRFEP